MLVDEVLITVKAGDGGNGAVSFKRNAQTSRGGPNGGNGGKGGDIYFTGINDITALSEFRYKKQILAQNGGKGGRQNLYGKGGEDSVVFLPLGTKVTNLKTNESFEITETLAKTLIAKGGKGGLGNNEFKSATNQTPMYAEKGEAGEEKKLLLELKLIADVGLIGLPNSGKSSLLSVLTRAHPKIGDYPFTTLEPNLGVLDGIVIADIPGLIEGASNGRGLGIKFLKHIEKTKLLIHCIGSEAENVAEAYKTIIKELKKYNPELLQKKQIIVLTKSDLVKKNDLDKKIKEAEKIGKEVISVSIYNDEELSSLKNYLLS